MTGGDDTPQGATPDALEVAEAGTLRPAALSVAEAAQATGVSTRTLRRYLEHGKLPNAEREPMATGGGFAWRIPVTDLLAAGLHVQAPADQAGEQPTAQPAPAGSLGEAPAPYPLAPAAHTAAKLAAPLDSMRAELEGAREALAAAQAEAAEYRRRAEVAEAYASERAAALMRADRDADDLRRALRMLEAGPLRTAPEAAPSAPAMPTPTAAEAAPAPGRWLRFGRKRP